MSRHLLIRADANTQIGTGHVMRCLALAQAWQDEGGTATLVARELPEGLQRILRSEQLEIITSPSLSETEDANNLVTLAKNLGSECVVVDGYSFGIVHQKALRNAGIRQLFIDDYGHAKEYVADFVLNQNLTADEAFYRNRDARTSLLLGTRYTLLRREFRRLRGWKRDFAETPTSILLTMGGADPDNITLASLQTLDKLRRTDLLVRVIVGASNSHRAALQDFRPEFLREIEILTTAAMPEMMQRSDLAISATGTTCLELMYMGLPFVGVAISDNQRPIAMELSKRGLADTVDCSNAEFTEVLRKSLERLLGSRSERISLGMRGQGIVDGGGATRIAELLSGSGLALECAAETDCKLIWKWANDPETRSASFESAIIPWEEHVRWYQSKLHDGNSRLWICRDGNNIAVGQVRFAIDGPNATISITLDPAHRGKGLGTVLIEAACRKLFNEEPVLRIHAFIKPANSGSVRAFERAGFMSENPTTIKGQPSLHYLLERREWTTA